ncbi:hypothetical protein HK405_006000 [Cladochytrium tenue]|nr:hypothetical protein HK405_006000 [Cladochytrium tenue]
MNNDDNSDASYNAAAAAAAATDDDDDGLQAALNSLVALVTSALQPHDAPGSAATEVPDHSILERALEHLWELTASTPAATAAFHALGGTAALARCVVVAVAAAGCDPLGSPGLPPPLPPPTPRVLELAVGILANSASAGTRASQNDEYEDDEEEDEGGRDTASDALAGLRVAAAAPRLIPALAELAAPAAAEDPAAQCYLASWSLAVAHQASRLLVALASRAAQVSVTSAAATRNLAESSIAPAASAATAAAAAAAAAMLDAALADAPAVVAYWVSRAVALPVASGATREFAAGNDAAVAARGLVLVLTALPDIDVDLAAPAADGDTALQPPPRRLLFPAAAAQAAMFAPQAYADQLGTLADALEASANTHDRQPPGPQSLQVDRPRRPSTAWWATAEAVVRRLPDVLGVSGSGGGNEGESGDAASLRKLAENAWRCVHALDADAGEAGRQNRGWDDDDDDNNNGWSDGGAGDRDDPGRQRKPASAPATIAAHLAATAFRTTATVQGVCAPLAAPDCVALAVLAARRLLPGLAGWLALNSAAAAATAAGLQATSTKDVWKWRVALRDLAAEAPAMAEGGVVVGRGERDQDALRAVTSASIGDDDDPTPALARFAGATAGLVLALLLRPDAPPPTTTTDAANLGPLLGLLQDAVDAGSVRLL